MTFFRDPLVSSVIGCAIEVHRIVGPGLLEPAYRPCLARELRDKAIQFRTEVTVPLRYKGEILDHSYRIDFLIEDWLIIELKSVEKILPVHVAQVATYLRLFGSRQGLIMNFNAPRLKDLSQKDFMKPSSFTPSCVTSDRWRAEVSSANHSASA